MTLTREDFRTGVYFHGPCPGGSQESMWSYSHATKTEKGVTYLWFTDCLQPFGTGLPVPFTVEQATELLQVVEREPAPT